jgi:hypothetical protein
VCIAELDSPPNLHLHITQRVGLCEKDIRRDHGQVCGSSPRGPVSRRQAQHWPTCECPELLAPDLVVEVVSLTPQLIFQ